MRTNRNKLFELLESGVLDAPTLARDLLNWLTDDECLDFAHVNDIDLGGDEAGPETEDFILPAHWASSLINGDRSGLDDGDEAQLDAWLEAHPGLGECLTHDDQEEFRSTHHATSVGVLACTCLMFTFPKN